MMRTKKQPQPPQHPMRPFIGADGNEYQRRADITMGEYRAYAESEITLRVQEQYFVALFMGLVPAATLLRPWSERLAASVDVFDAWTFDQYFAVRDTLINDIVNPASPKAGASQTSDA